MSKPARKAWLVDVHNLSRRELFVKSAQFLLWGVAVSLFYWLVAYPLATRALGPPASATTLKAWLVGVPMWALFILAMLLVLGSLSLFVRACSRRLSAQRAKPVP